MMKKSYTKAELTLIRMDEEDIVATSGISEANFDSLTEDKAAFNDLIQ